jgi:hypothetical protein
MNIEQTSSDETMKKSAEALEDEGTNEFAPWND